MADVIRLSSSLLNNFHPLAVSNSNSTKNGCKFADLTPSAILVSAAPLPFSLKPRKRTASPKVNAVVSEATDQPKWWEKNAGPNMIDIHSTEEFLSALSEAGDKLVVVEFYGTWCASCRALFPKLCRTAAEHPEILFLKVNFDENKAMCKSMNVKVLPYFNFYRGADGKVDGFSCSLAKFQKIKDAIELHNPTGGNNKATKVGDELGSNSSPNVENKPAESSET